MTHECETMLFAVYFTCGLGFPMLPFVRNIELVNLSPNSVLVMSIFMHLCEPFMGVHSKPDVFCVFYVLMMTSEKAVGCVSFHLQGGH